MPFEINFDATEEELTARFGDTIIIHGDVESVNGKTGVVVLDADDVGAVPAGEYDPDAKTESMTQAVGVDVNGKLWTAPGGGGGGAVDSVNGQTGAVVLDAEDVGALPDDTVIPTKTSDLENDSGFLTSAPVTSVNSKTGAVTLNASDVGAGTYSKPSGGIPKSDLANDVQTSLGKADSALQSAPVTSVNSKTGAVSLDKSDVGLGNVDNVQQYSASNPPPYPVTSVNGSVGAVILTASGLGALPKTTTLTIATTDWNSLSCTKTVTGMTATAVVWLEYSDTTTVFTCSQGTDALTFTCDATPSAAVTVKVAFMEEVALT